MPQSPQTPGSPAAMMAEMENMQKSLQELQQMCKTAEQDSSSSSSSSTSNKITVDLTAWASNLTSLQNYFQQLNLPAGRQSVQDVSSACESLRKTFSSADMLQQLNSELQRAMDWKERTPKTLLREQYTKYEEECKKVQELRAHRPQPTNGRSRLTAVELDKRWTDLLLQHEVALGASMQTTQDVESLEAAMKENVEADDVNETLKKMTQDVKDFCVDLCDGLERLEIIVTTIKNQQVRKYTDECCELKQQLRVGRQQLSSQWQHIYATYRSSKQKVAQAHARDILAKRQELSQRELIDAHCDELGAQIARHTEAIKKVQEEVKQYDAKQVTMKNMLARDQTGPPRQFKRVLTDSLEEEQNPNSGAQKRTRTTQEGGFVARGSALAVPPKLPPPPRHPQPSLQRRAPQKPTRQKSTAKKVFDWVWASLMD
eukprot:TRINITY_DN59487_c0_g1_i1.p1 TRINITY_DN59487_c0_g1~~TRINITY_DN59487_c0_g1_i1.p1  ORF type:complete len:430 (+),score=57.09 TRINITY_DN59487_c0_g1_i1:42-1331(+)